MDRDFNYLYEIKADLLSKYYVGTTYPPLIKATKQDAGKAVEVAERVREFALRKLRLPPDTS